MGALFGDHLIFEGELPVGWRPLEALPEGMALGRLNLAGEDLLHVIAGQEAMRPDGSDDEDPVADQLLKLEYKVNLLVDLVGQLLRQNLALPAERFLRFNAEGVEWTPEEESPAEGALVMIELYLSAVIPRPLRLPGRVVEVAEGVVGVRFEGMAQPLSDQIHKFVFRHHRRAVARARSAVPSE